MRDARSNSNDAPPAHLGAAQELRLLAPSEVAARCGLSRRAVYDAIRRGDLPAVRLCSRLRVTPAAFAAWLQENTVTIDRGADPARDGAPPPRPAESTFRGLLRNQASGGSA